jgi:hypothetical protein
VADWRGSQVAIFEAENYGTKREQFIRFLNVPVLAGERFDLALCIGQHDFEDLGLLLGHNWKVRDPYEYAGDLESYREFIQYSRAEFSVAKSGYVKSRSGWISDRTACYLASGKPAIIQSTGLEWRLPTGKGLMSFSTPDEAVRAIQSMNHDYIGHCRGARLVVVSVLDWTPSAAIPAVGVIAALPPLPPAELVQQARDVLRSMLEQVDLWPVAKSRVAVGAQPRGGNTPHRAAELRVSSAAVVCTAVPAEEQVS